MSKPKTVVVLGAGRSGTPVTTGLVKILGVELGSVRMLDATNPRGYFEDDQDSKLIGEILDSAKFGRLKPLSSNQ